MKEIWKKVRGKEEYAEISNYGKIHRFEREYYCGTNHKSKRIQEEDWTYGSESGDYLRATIGGVNKGVHVWVYMTFHDCDIPEGLEVNHIDEDKHNNRLDNLNLMTPKENTNWGTGIERKAAARRGKHYPKMSAALRGRKHSEETKAKIGATQKNDPKKSKAVQALDKNGNIVYEFPSTAEAQRQGFNAGAISECCNGKRKSYKGYIWRFIEK